MVSLNPFKTVHDRKMPESVGVCINLYDSKNSSKNEPKITIGISSDTCYSKRIEKCLSKCDIVIANFSKTHEKDMIGKDKNCFLKKHLGFTGVLNIFSGTNADLCIASEWSEHMSDCRHLITKMWRCKIEDDSKTILPSEIGMRVLLPDKKIKCSFCDNFEKPKDVKIIRPQIPFGQLKYLCKDCIF